MAYIVPPEQQNIVDVGGFTRPVCALMKQNGEVIKKRYKVLHALFAFCWTERYERGEGGGGGYNV